MKKPAPYAELRRMIAETKDFYAFWTYFFDRFIGYEAFRDAGGSAGGEHGESAEPFQPSIVCMPV